MADLGCIPSDETIIRQITKRIGPQDGLVCLWHKYAHPMDGVELGVGPVRIIAKGVVTKWPQPVTESYEEEHRDAVVDAGKKVDTWQDITYQRLAES